MEPDEAFAGRLLEGETMLWSGRPAQGWRLGTGPLVVAVVMVFSVVRVLVAPSGGRSNLGGALIALLFGAWFVSRPLRRDARLRNATWYAVTDRRILILRAGRWPGFLALTRAQLTGVALQETVAGRGTIDFGPQPGQDRMLPFGLRLRTPTSLPARFIAIDQARHVFQLIERWRTGSPVVSETVPRSRDAVCPRDRRRS